MFGNSKKRSRLDLWRGQLKATRQATAAERWARRRHLFSRLAIGAVTVLLVSLIVHGGGGHWGPPFPFREGEVYPRDIRVKTDFTIIDEPSTQFKREQAAAAVHPVLRLDSQPLEELLARLTELCLAARSGSPLDRLDNETVRYWAPLTRDDLKALGQTLQGPPEERLALFAVTPLPVIGAAPGQPLAALTLVKARYPIESDDDLRRRLEAAFANLLAVGIAEDDKLPEAVRQARQLTVRRAPGEPDLVVLPEQVLKSKLVRPPDGAGKGAVYLQFAKALKDERIADALHRLVVGDEKRKGRLPATLTYDEEATRVARERAQAAVEVQTKEYKRGAPLVEQGKPIAEQDLTLLKAEHRAYLASLTWADHLRRWLSLVVIVSAFGGFIGLYIHRFHPALAGSRGRLLGVCALLTLTLWAASFFSQTPWHASIVPLTMTAMILAIAFDQPFALVVSFSMALITTLSLGTGLERHFLVLVGGLTVAVLLLRNVRTRSKLVQIGFFAGLAYAVMTLAVGLLTGQSWELIGLDAFRRFMLGLVAGLFLSGLLPFVERAFGVVTDISLLELTDVSHPLLQELVRRAPGTYTHSMTVATLAEAAAEAIGANPLLTRVGACFHDIGKMLKPHYFIENQTGENLHNTLAPAMSTLIIIGHVKDGVELGKQHKLPQPIIDFIQQHHGTTLVEYFYREAAKALEPHQPNGELEAAFRYPGPKPQNREIGIVMLADALEGASRALSEPTPGSLKKLVHDILLKRLLDGQFDESGLTLTELRTIEDSLCKNLIALYHARVKYPEAKSAV